MNNKPEFRDGGIPFLFYNKRMEGNKKIGVLIGGPSSKHDISVETGFNVLRALREYYDAVPIFITKTGHYTLGYKKEFVTPIEAFNKVDLVFNGLHGEYGEDGKVQTLLEKTGVSYTGSRVIPSAIAMNAELTHKAFLQAGLSMPRYLILQKDEYNEKTILRKAVAFSAAPWVVKPVRKNFLCEPVTAWNEKELQNAFQNAFTSGNKVLLQEWRKGKEIMCGVIENMRQEQCFALPPVEKDRLCDVYDAMLKRIRETASKAHTALGCRHYSAVTMFLQGTKIDVLEVNTLPEFTAKSPFLRAAEATGIGFHQFLHHLINLASP